MVQGAVHPWSQDTGASDHITCMVWMQKATDGCRLTAQHLLSFTSSLGPIHGNSTTHVQGECLTSVNPVKETPPRPITTAILGWVDLSWQSQSPPRQKVGTYPPWLPSVCIRTLKWNSRKVGGQCRSAPRNTVSCQEMTAKTRWPCLLLGYEFQLGTSLLSSLKVRRTVV